MLNRMSRLLIPKQRIFFILLALVGLLVYMFQSWGHIHGQVSVIDEGLYLYKGYLFTQGTYTPFQDYGPLTNHMPFSFLIPGWIQSIFGAGIRTGRYASMFIGIMLISGLWQLTRRFAGNAWANVAVWGIALNPALVKIYSQAISQVLVAMMLVWVLVLTTGKGRRLPEIIAGSLLAATLGLTRINMLPVWILLMLVILWQHGRRTATYAFLAGMLLLVGIHAIYWPEILKLWAKWIPESITPFLQGYRSPTGLIPAWNPHPSLSGRQESLLIATRMHLLPIEGFLLFLLFSIFPRIQNDQWKQQAGVFMALLFFILFVLHAWASLSLDYCVFCLKNYLAFFSPIGLVLFAFAGQETLRTRSRTLATSSLGLMIGFPLFLGLDPGNALITSLLSTDITRVSGASIRPGTVPLLVMLENKSGLSAGSLQHLGSFIIYGLGGMLVMALLLVLIREIRRGVFFQATPAIKTISILNLAVFLGLTTITFGNGYTNYDCGQDEIATVEDVGRQLREVIPAGSKVFWGTRQSPVPLLYLEDINIYPQQLNGDYSFWYGGDTDSLLEFGLWNDEASARWLESADYILTNARRFGATFQGAKESHVWEPVLTTDSPNACDQESSILVFRSIE